MESDPVALSGRRFWRSLRTAAPLIVIVGSSGKGLLPLLGMLVVSSSVKIDLNWWFNISALPTRRFSGNHPCPAEGVPPQTPGPSFYVGLESFGVELS